MGRDADAEDQESYQTVFAKQPGSVAAPTASLHFTQSALDALAANGVALPRVLLHVSAGTFKPVETSQIEEHPMHSESYALTQECVETLQAVRQRGGRVIAAGTTAARVLETCSASGELMAGHGETRLFVRPGYSWKCVDGLLTNFHWPKSTLFMLIASLLGLERAQALYADAIRREFRLFSYGDAMLIL
jgi:S-adenosylmethionine:tRNA ribosyltransferase-isomerase